jgi:hypothetical protein
MGGGFPGNTFEMGGCDGSCQWQQETVTQAEMKIVECRECFMRGSVQHPGNGGGSEIKTAWMFGGHLWNSGTPGYVKPFTPDGADTNYEQLCFMIASYIGTGKHGHLTGYKITSSAASTKMIKAWNDYGKTYKQLLSAPALSVRAPACAFPTGSGCQGWNMSQGSEPGCWHCDLTLLDQAWDGLFHYVPIEFFTDPGPKALLVLYNQGRQPITIETLSLNVALMGANSSLAVVVGGAQMRALPITRHSPTVANVTLPELHLHARSVTSVFFYATLAEARAHPADWSMSCTKPSSTVRAPNK